METIRVLSIDGGGIRGIIPLMLLRYIEETTGYRIHELFHVLGGTSTGGIICLALNSINPKTKKIYTAGEVLEFYLEKASKIFKKRENFSDTTRKIFSYLNHDEKGAGFFESQYGKEGIEEFLKEAFGQNLKISELPTSCDVTVCSYDIKNDKPHYFTKESEDWLVWQAARATSAAPSFFPVAEFNKSGQASKFIDGGVFINNPALNLYYKAKEMNPQKQIILVSLGTGEATNEYNPSNDGATGWLKNGALLEIMMKGVSKNVDEIMQKILKENYYRMQVQLDKPIDLDATEQNVLSQLQVYGRSIIHDTGNDRFKQLCQTLGNKKIAFPWIQVAYIDGENMEEQGNDDWSGAKRNLYVYRPSKQLIDEGWYWLGQYGTSHKFNPKRTIIVKALREGNFFKKPEDYILRWSDKGSRNKKSYSAWQIIPPKGYLAMGALMRLNKGNYEQPTEQETEGLMCVRADLCEDAQVGNENVWDDSGTWATENVTLWPIEPKSDEKGINPGTFICYPAKQSSKPSEILEACIKKQIAEEITY
ncbi:patatin-like phospholipase family protein [Microcoleus sp. D3_18_C4]|uniref:patatin-like phospholipase family protein n=1 Tax=Microcoleus sp. D3_18_C4 TaxID=3055335 RepID=UPI002FCFC3C5